MTSTIAASSICEHTVSRERPGRRRVGPVLGVVLLAAVTAGPVRAQDRFENVQIETSHAAGSVYMLTGAGGNIGTSVGEDGTLIVDDQFAPLAPRIRSALNSLGEGGVEWVLNTHWHHDHTLGNTEFGKEAPIVSHANVRERLASAQLVRGDTLGPLPEEGLPVLTFGDSVSLHFNGERIRVIHFPHAHTDGDAAVFFTGSNVVHMGDLYFEGRFPFVDLATGGDVEGMARAVERVLDEVPSDATVIPGHGELSDVSGLQRYHEMLVETIAHVRDLMSQGMGLQQIQARGLPDEWEEWSWQFITESRWVETIYRSLSG